MCGFVGILHTGSKANVDWATAIKQANLKIDHRGPDETGYYSDEYVNLAFSRLSIIDVENGQQPLSYDNERYWIIFNGEIYNYLELKAELTEEGYHFETTSDTEVILAAYQNWGDQTPNKLRGMFSFLIWDKQKKSLFGARDPFGIKPLYYYPSNNAILFASEKKSILEVMKQKELNLEALQHYFTYQYVPEPMSMIKDIKKVVPGTHVQVRPGKEINFHKYWIPKLSPVPKEENRLIGDIQEALFDSVKVHMRSDVPLGSFLSGGIDSTIVVSIAKEFNPNINTFSVGFDVNGYNEMDVAAETAEKLNLPHHKYNVTPNEFMSALPKIVWHLDDPLADPSVVPLYFLAKEARKKVKVVLSGEGADELFGGYNIYREPLALKPFSYIPKGMKRSIRSVVKNIPSHIKGRNYLLRGCTPLEERYCGNAKIFSEEEKFHLLTGYQNSYDSLELIRHYYEDAAELAAIEKMQYIDIQTWLKGDILLKADKMTMANSLELRVPFLDKEIFKVASSIPGDWKTRNQTTKYILRKAAETIIPEHVLNRKKLGFPVPLRNWLKDEMYDWTIKLIKESETEYLLDKSYAFKLLEEHVQGKHDNSRKIWSIIIFMMWHQVFIEDKYSFTNTVHGTNKEYSIV
ncbi:asparagine synthase (glutamine-hydrolyzing) [Metabacillus arenae]|uniref:asparagine synthase (glutamine-hydrolyzing) n=1 Tax=Metabacillus arenae TaxID=2771434 RepID=A0A926RXK1_9BACI|nr:asparagine synthase (glutamine-hydrolyzing) [Metabacillus arenae]MBD1380222.1 asparagine synthase (glutamine-hydrolyzing) [Metabacillus arenae]